MKERQPAKRTITNKHLRNNQRKKDYQMMITGNIIDIKRKIVYKS